MECDVSRRCENTIRMPSPLLSNLSAVLFSNSGLVPLKNRLYTLRLDNGPVISGTTDHEGYLSHQDVPVGDYLLEIDGVRAYVPTISNPDARLPIRVGGYFLIGESDDESCQERVTFEETSEETSADELEEEAPEDNSDEEEWEDLTDT